MKFFDKEISEMSLEDLIKASLIIKTANEAFATAGYDIVDSKLNYLKLLDQRINIYYYLRISEEYLKKLGKV